ncbi:MAG: GNAT family N-acetyltransferase [Peptococcaceae bacterium]|nr:GNAT family N-acetyltransferase [Peptococcaceae bacterium]
MNAVKKQTSLYACFIFRSILPEEAEQAVAIETECFPPHEACKPEIMRARVAVAADRFLVAVDRKTGKIAGFVDGLATNDEVLRDAIYIDAQLHEPQGRNVMILGVNVLPAYRRQGLAREMVAQFLQREKVRGTRRVILTCLEHRVAMYEGFGFHVVGHSDSTWGDEEWIEMDARLN